MTVQQARDSNAGKRRRVLDMLTDPLMAPNPNAEIARFCDVTPGFVAKVRAEVDAMGPAFIKGSIHRLPVESLRLDGGTQPRAGLDAEVVEDYRRALDAGAAFPPVGVVYDGTDYWTWDGFHRAEAHRLAGRGTITAEVRQGTRRDAVLLSVGANVTHGLRRSGADKRRAVETLLHDPEWGTWSDRKLGDLAGVDGKTVAVIRAKLEGNAEIPQCPARHTADGREYPARRRTEPVREGKPTGRPPREASPTLGKAEASRPLPAPSADPAEASRENLRLSDFEGCEDLFSTDPDPSPEDAAWLETLRLAKLLAGNPVARQAFDRDAFAWKAAAPLLAQLRAVVMKAAGNRPDYQSGPFYNAMMRLTRAGSPNGWPPCPRCEGRGLKDGEHTCRRCKGKCYVILEL